jgi:hypothetical protein
VIRVVKDPNATKDYQNAWTLDPGDSIVTSTWTSADPLWQPLTTYQVDERVRLSSGEVLEVKVAGISGSSQPSAPAIGSTRVDGTVTWLRSFNIQSTSFTTTTATVWVTGGTANREYGVTNHITTNGSRTEDETLYFVIVDK